MSNKPATFVIFRFSLSLPETRGIFLSISPASLPSPPIVRLTGSLSSSPKAFTFPLSWNPGAPDTSRYDTFVMMKGTPYEVKSQFASWSLGTATSMEPETSCKFCELTTISKFTSSSGLFGLVSFREGRNNFTG